MRFTLRMILAYLDDTLEPTQARELGHRIHKSETARSIIDRIKTVVRRRRLIAPDVNPELATLDANASAEYVDNAGAADALLKVERTILESDMHLAEVSVVHQIASLGLTTLPEPSPALRRRMELILNQAGVYGIRPARKTPRFASLLEAPGDEGEEDAPLPLAMPRLISPRTFKGQLAAGGLVVALGALLVFVVHRSVNEATRAPTMVVGAEARLAAEADAGRRLVEAPSEPVEADGSKPAAESPTPSGDRKAAAGDSKAPRDKAAGEPIQAAKPETPADKPADKSAEKPTASEPESKPAAKDQAGPADAKTSVPAETKPEVEPAASKPGTELAAVDRAAVAKRAEEIEKSDAAVKGGSKTADRPKLPIAPAPKPASSESESDSPADVAEPGLPVARYVSSSGLLFRRHAQSFHRLTSTKQAEAGDPVDDVLRVGEWAMTGDGFRSEIELANGARVELVDQSAIRFRSPPQDQVGADAAFELRFGRLIFETGGKKTNVALGFHGAECRFDLSGEKAAVAVEGRIESPGLSLEEANQSARLLSVTLLRGKASVQFAGASEAIELKVDSQLLIRPGMPTEIRALEKPPAWTDPQSVPAENRTAERFASLLHFGAEAISDLRGRLTDPAREYRRLAVRALAGAEQIELLAEALRSEHGEVRNLAAAGLRRFAMENPGRGQALANAFLVGYPAEEASELREMTAGYGPAALSTPEIYETLIARLESPQLAVRELAGFNLREIAGKGFGFDANAKDSQRRLVVNQWRRWLAGQQTLPPKRSAAK